MQKPDEHQDEIFKIGSVSRLTGLSTHILRKWESRYGAIAPRRTERGERGYTREDVERLSLIKRLVDSGSAPRDVARKPPPRRRRGALRRSWRSGPG